MSKKDPINLLVYLILAGIALGIFSTIVDIYKYSNRPPHPEAYDIGKLVKKHKLPITTNPYKTSYNKAYFIKGYLAE